MLKKDCWDADKKNKNIEMLLKNKEHWDAAKYTNTIEKYNLGNLKVYTDLILYSNRVPSYWPHISCMIYVVGGGGGDTVTIRDQCSYS